MNLANQTVHRRRGVALLIVLGVLLIVATSVSLLVSAAAERALQRADAHHDAMGFDVLAALEAPIQQWLSHDSARVILQPNCSSPAVEVLSDELIVDGVSVGVRLTAFDQLGMVPMQLARSASPLRAALPAHVAETLDRTELPPESEATPLGLDLVNASDGLMSMYPKANKNAFGGLVATHNGDPVRINIHTSPRPLLGAALRAAGRGDLERILVAREKGTPIGHEVLSHLREGDGSLIPTLVTTSDCWAFRCDIEVGTLKRSWWSIYRPGPDDAGTVAVERWRCIQRLEIDS